MSINLNSAVIGGRIGRDIEPKFTAGGKCVAKFSLAIDDGYGENKRTNWIPVTCFDKLAESVAQYCGKGSEVVVEGRISVSQYEKDGDKRTFTEVIANRVHFGSKAQGEHSPHGRGAAVPPGQGEEEQDDIPF